MIKREFVGVVSDFSTSFDGGKFVEVTVRVEGKEKVEISYHQPAPATIPLQGVRSGGRVRVTLTIEDVEDE